MRVLILGGTGEANRLATSLAARQVDAIYSYAGRTSVPVPQPLPTRTGGFGGEEGLAGFLQTEGITHVIDATHPFAAEMSRRALAACRATGVQLMALEREAWCQQEGDAWINVPGLAAAAETLPERPARVFLAIGRQHLAAFAAKPQHAYTLRFVDQPGAGVPIPNAHIIVDRGPFSIAGEIELLTSRAIEWIVARNSGGDGARAKIIAARQLGIPVIMIARPIVPERSRLQSVEAVLQWLAHETRLGA